MRITSAAEYSYEAVELTSAVLFRGDAQTAAMAFGRVRLLPSTKGGLGSECFVSRASKIMYSLRGM